MKENEGTVNPDLKVAPEMFLKEVISQDYVPQAILGMYGYVGLMNRNRPPFTYWVIRDMLCDPRVLFGLMLLKGPIISKPTFQVDCQDTVVGEFIHKNLSRFWTVGALRVLKAIEWGYSGSEVLYRYNPDDGLIYFDQIRDLESLDCRPVVLKGQVVGFKFRMTQDPYGHTVANGDDPRDDVNKDGWYYVGAPRALWHLHWRDRNPWFGLSRLFGTHVPWYEMWSEDGYRQIRRLWFTGCAFDGGVMYHPPGLIATPQGNKPCRDYAREMLEKKRTGAVLTLPNSPSGDGSSRSWEYQPPSPNPTPAGLLEYGDDLRSEIFESLGIPPEVIQSSGDTGFGSSSGRGVPQEAYNSILFSIATDLLLDFDRYCLRYLVNTLFGPVHYELFCTPLDAQQALEQPQGPEEGFPEDDQGEEGMDQGDEQAA